MPGRPYFRKTLQILESKISVLEDLFGKTEKYLKKTSLVVNKKEESLKQWTHQADHQLVLFNDAIKTARQLKEEILAFQEKLSSAVAIQVPPSPQQPSFHLNHLKNIPPSQQPSSHAPYPSHPPYPSYSQQQQQPSSSAPLPPSNGQGGMHSSQENPFSSSQEPFSDTNPARKLKQIFRHSMEDKDSDMA